MGKKQKSALKFVLFVGRKHIELINASKFPVSPASFAPSFDASSSVCDTINLSLPRVFFFLRLFARSLTSMTKGEARDERNNKQTNGWRLGMIILFVVPFYLGSLTTKVQSLTRVGCNRYRL
jgi:hypothetical protein